MHCFNHPEKNSVGTCKQCSKGLCPDCAVDLGHGLACRGHEQRVEDLEKLMTGSSQLMAGTAKLQSKMDGLKFFSPGLYLFMGTVFTGYGLLYARDSKLFVTAVGIGFLVFGLLEFLGNRKSRD
jgi:X-X-X-Leu-X-X-Gly heptad repeat protein